MKFFETGFITPRWLLQIWREDRILTFDERSKLIEVCHQPRNVAGTSLPPASQRRGNIISRSASKCFVRSFVRPSRAFRPSESKLSLLEARALLATLTTVGPQAIAPETNSASPTIHAAFTPPDQANAADANAAEAADPTYDGQLPAPPVPPAPPAPPAPPTFKTLDEAVLDWASKYSDDSIRDNREYGSTLFQNPDGSYGYTPVDKTGTDRRVVIPSAPRGTKDLGDIHAHGAYDPNPDFYNHTFSPPDIDGINSDSRGKPGYVGYVTTTDGTLQKYDPATGKTTVVRTDLPSSSNDPDRKNQVDPTYDFVLPPMSPTQP